jgi:subtilase family serine protease
MQRSVWQFVSFCCMLSPCSVPLWAQRNRITGAIDGSRKAILQRSVHPKAEPRLDQGPVDPLLPMGYVTVMLKPSPGQQATLEQLLEEQQNRSSPNYHRWLTPEQFGDRFGLSSADYGAVASWLESEGLRIENVARARNWIACSGLVRQVQGAFHTEIHRYLVDGETHFANAAELSIPAALDGVVSGVRGLDDFFPKAGRADPYYATPSGAHWLAPDDWATIYDVTPLYNMGIDGTGQRIAIMGRSSIDPSQMDRFRSMFGLSPSAIEQHLVGPDPGVTNAAGEAALDLEWSGAIARNATLVYVYANNFNDAVQATVDQNLASVMSESAGTCEPLTSVGNRSMAQQANAQGITWLASSGDSGGAGCDPHANAAGPGPPSASGGLAVSIPASYPEVTAVGGTELDYSGGNYWSSSGAALSYIPEAVWNNTGPNGLLASGGGTSIYFPKPAWQIAPGVPSDNARDVPDISFSAGGTQSHYFVINANGIVGTGGTSASSPSFAGVVALLNHYQVSQGFQAQPGLGNINPDLYRLARITTDVFHDITQGDNIVPCTMGSPDCAGGTLGFTAGPGYDLATGLGSVDVYNLVTEWNAAAAGTITTLTANPGTINLGDPVQLTATVAGATAPGPPTGAVTFVTGRTILGTAVLVNSGGIATATLAVTRPLLPVGSATVTATYSGDNGFDGSTGTVAVSVAAQSPGSAVTISITPNPAPEGQAVRVALTEEAGVGTRITGWTINGVDDFPNFVGDFGSDLLPPYGTLSVGLFTAMPVAIPSNRVYIFNGVDADGRQWSQQYTLTLVGSATPGILLSASPLQNPACQASQQLTVRERNGLNVQLTRFLVNGEDWTGQIQQLFGATTLTAFATLQAPICWPDANPPQTATYEVDGTDQIGSPVTATLTTSFVDSASSLAGKRSRRLRR